MIHITKKGGESKGPFTLEEVLAGLKSGQWTSEDYGWKEGMGDWRPLSEVLGSLPPVPPGQTPPPPVPAGPKTAPQSLVVLAYVFSCVSVIPYVGFLTAVVGFILGIVLCTQNRVMHGVINIILSIILPFMLIVVIIAILTLMGEQLQEIFGKITQTLSAPPEP